MNEKAKERIIELISQSARRYLDGSLSSESPAGFLRSMFSWHRDILGRSPTEREIEIFEDLLIDQIMQAFDLPYFPEDEED